MSISCNSRDNACPNIKAKTLEESENTIYRTIFWYTRDAVVPTWDTKEAIVEIESIYPFFFFDIIHFSPTSKKDKNYNKKRAQAIFDEFQLSNQQVTLSILQSGIPTFSTTCMTLLANPLQRSVDEYKRMIIDLDKPIEV
eukprot:TRINITY_DN5023_c0_g1_i2.p1 TRINITY_DN5023_c0_g1~~TRINITY_DN5023_c0_g1_i2.p1  ORF type:complete len:140 (+),score=33.02 TRINITY_DN5023_c0_g1_i2:377-796(+)